MIRTDVIKEIQNRPQILWNIFEIPEFWTVLYI
jgi:hypothetical protein